jgi:hypothetical protein
LHDTEISRKYEGRDSIKRARLSSSAEHLTLTDNPTAPIHQGQTGAILGGPIVAD